MIRDTATTADAESSVRRLNQKPATGAVTVGFLAHPSAPCLPAPGRPTDARPHLCQALAHADVQTQREAEAVLTEHGLGCD